MAGMGLDRMMRFFGVFATFVFLLGANAQAQEATHVDVLEYGLYEIGPSVGEFAPPNMGYRHESISEARHLQTTRTVPGQVGVAFGVRYRVEGTDPGAVVPIRIVIQFPEQGLYSHDYRDTLYVDEFDSFAVLGEEDYSGISFDEEWEIEPGFWTIEFWSGDTKIGEEKFEVITPPVS